MSNILDIIETFNSGWSPRLCHDPQQRVAQRSLDLRIAGNPVDHRKGGGSEVSCEDIIACAVRGETSKQLPAGGLGESVYLSEVIMTQRSRQTAPNHKEAAIEFMRLVASGKVRKAYREHIAADFRHHNPFFRGDAESLMVAMEENAAKNPNKVLEIQRALQDGDLVAVHSRIKQTPDDRGGAVVHIFRFHGDRIVELWDVGQPIPENSPNQHGMF